MKRKIFSCAVIVMCLSIFAWGTLAYFTADDKAHNVITSGNIKIELQEWQDADKTVPFPEGGISGVMPGADVTKIVEVKNTGSNAAYIRVKVDVNVVAADGEALSTEPISINYDTENWTYGEDGYYYYNNALEAKDLTAPLFTKVTFDPTMGNEYQSCKTTVDVTAYAVQVANNGDDVMKAAGWPAE